MMTGFLAVQGIEVHAETQQDDRRGRKCGGKRGIRS